MLCSGPAGSLWPESDLCHMCCCSRQLAPHEPRPAATNEDLVTHLMRHDTLHT